MKSIHVCTFARQPDEERECLEAIWSVGRACKKCVSDCYRRGWPKWAVDTDNKILVSLDSQPIAARAHIAEMRKGMIA